MQPYYPFFKYIHLFLMERLFIQNDFFYANRCNIHYYIIDIKMNFFVKKYTFLFGKHTIIKRQGFSGFPRIGLVKCQ